MSTAPNRRDELARQREAEAAKTRRNRMIAVICALVAVASIIGAVVFTLSKQKPSTTASGSTAAMSETDTKSLMDKASMTADKHGFTVAGATAKADAPRVSIISDAQCPACKILENGAGEELIKLAKSGDIALEHLPVTFLDGSLHNDSSHRATMAMTCAAGVGKYSEYNTALFKDQPEEGVGYTNEDLTSKIAQSAGITGDDLKTFQSCYAGGHTSDMVKEIDTANQKTLLASDKEPGTPTVLVNGKKIQWSEFFTRGANGEPVADPAKVMETIKAAAK